MTAKRYTYEIKIKEWNEVTISKTRDVDKEWKAFQELLLIDAKEISGMKLGRERWKGSEWQKDEKNN